MVSNLSVEISFLKYIEKSDPFFRPWAGSLAFKLPNPMKTFCASMLDSQGRRCSVCACVQADCPKAECFESLSAMELAEQITLLDHIVFRSIPYESVSQSSCSQRSMLLITRPLCALCYYRKQGQSSAPWIYFKRWISIIPSDLYCVLT